MQQPTQPQFKLRVFNPGITPNSQDDFKVRGVKLVSDGGGNYIDIESCMAPQVTYEEEASLLNTLQFTVDKDADVLLHKMRLGQWITFFGGHYDETGRGMRKVFSGTITRIRTQFPDNGRMKFTVEAMAYGYTQMSKNKALYYVYPDKNSTRSFAKGKTTLGLKDLIVGIVEESGMTVGEISLPKTVANHTFTEKKLRSQRGLSDWKFLLELAKDFGCTMWMETYNGSEVFYFVDKHKTANTWNRDIGFVYPLQGYSLITNIHAEEIQYFDEVMWNRPRILRTVTVDEDISMAYAVSRSAQYFDKETGEYKEAIAEITETEAGKVMRFYTLDEARVEEVNRLHPEVADQIRSSGEAPGGWSSGCKDIKDETPQYTRYYYKETKVVDEQTAVFDKAFFGIYLTAKCNMDLDIRSQMSYYIRGIVRYSTQRNNPWFLRGLKHIWDTDGLTTELDFIQ